MITRRSVVAAGLTTAVAGRISRSKAAATEIKIGNTAAYSGSASSYSVIPKTDAAYFKMINEQGGIDGRKINFISLDDGYSPPKTVEDVRRLVEQDGVDLCFNQLGTPCNTAVVGYLNEHKIPHLFVGTGASKWGDYEKYPWTMGYQPSYRTEAQIYMKHMLKTVQDPKLGLLYQNDDFGKDYASGARDVLGQNWSKIVVKDTTYESTDATVDSQVQELHDSGANVILVVGLQKFAAQAIRKVYDLQWKPAFYMTNVAISVGAVMNPVGPEKAIGMLSTAYLKDPTDAAWKDDTGMQKWRAFMTKYYPGGDQNDASTTYGYGVAMTMVQVLKQCSGDFSHANIMQQAESLHQMENPTLLPGIKIDTSHTDHRPIKAMQMARWDGKTWVRFGDIIEGTAS